MQSECFRRAGCGLSSGKHFKPGVRWTACLALFVTIVTLWRAGLTRPSCSQNALVSAQLENIMFVDAGDVAEYRNKCGTDWHQLFAAWEFNQRAALRGDTAVKIIVWRCRQLCGGLGDRQRGILTSFALALVTDRAFFIDSENPVPLQHYFRVANPDLHWTFDNSLLEGRKHIEEDFLNALPPVGDFASANLSYYDTYDVVIQLNNFWQPLRVLQNPSLSSGHLLRSYEDHILAGCMLNYLLVPTRDLQMTIHNSKQQATKDKQHMLALQIRTGDSQFKNDTVLNIVARRFADCVSNIQQASNFKFKIFLTTDAVEIEQKFKATHADLVMFNGQIVHIDGAFGPADSPASSFRKVVLDHIMISRATSLVLSRSGFGEMAAVRGFRSYFTPMACDFVPHYMFPSKEPQGVPATDINSVEELFSGFEAALI